MFASGFASAKIHCIVENIFQQGQWAILEWRDPGGLRFEGLRVFPCGGRANHFSARLLGQVIVLTPARSCVAKAVIRWRPLNFTVRHRENGMEPSSVLDLKEAVALKGRYPTITAKPPALQQWGLRVLYLTDPTGVLWHIADRRTQ